MEHNLLTSLWVLCDEDACGAKEVDGYPNGKAYIARKDFSGDVVKTCRRAAWNVLFYSDGMDEALPVSSYIVTEGGELKGHLYDGTALWYADFDIDGQHETSYKRVNGALVRLGFSRW